MRPFEQAWSLLKRQTTLGEFHPEFPSPHGPVVYYHGTPVENVPDIKQRGLLASSPRHGYGGAFVSTEPTARSYGRRWRSDPAGGREVPGGLIGIRRAAGTPEPYWGYGDGLEYPREAQVWDGENWVAPDSPTRIHGPIDDEDWAEGKPEAPREHDRSWRFMNDIPPEYLTNLTDYKFPEQTVSRRLSAREKDEISDQFRGHESDVEEWDEEGESNWDKAAEQADFWIGRAEDPTSMPYVPRREKPESFADPPFYYEGEPPELGRLSEFDLDDWARQWGTQNTGDDTWGVGATT